MNLLKQALRVVAPVGLVLAMIGMTTPVQAGGNGGGGGDGLKKRIASRTVVDQMYRDMLGREADEAAIKLYGGALEQGKSAENVKKMIAFSPEAGLVINDRFQKFVGREASDEEMMKVRKELNEGATISQLENKLAKMGQKGHGKRK